ncbi:MAG: tail fiber domain-containing protein [Pseudonocardia sp.]
MADYTQPDVVNKRVRFFDGQFLQDQDLIDEQRYHLDRVRRLPAIVGMRGIVTGLAVVSPGAYQVRVTPGSAVDARGRQLVLAADLTLALPANQFSDTRDVDLVLVFQELPADLAQTGSESHRRFDETPKLAAVTPDGKVAVAPAGALPTWDGPSVPLARLVVSAAGAITVDAPVTLRAGLAVPGRVGVGTATPGVPLDVVGSGGDQVDLRVTGRVQSLSDDGGLAVGTNRVVGGHAGNRVGFHAGDAWRLSIGQDGHVGIGTTVPENAGGWDTNVDLYGTTTKLSVRTSSVDGRLVAHDVGVWGAPAGLVVGTQSAHAVSIGTGGASRLTVDAGGNVGVGTTAPVARLHVSGSDGKNVDVLVDGRLRSNNDDGGLWIGTNRFVGGCEVDKVGFFTGRAFRLTVLPNGHVGINTTTPEDEGKWGSNVDVYGTSTKLSVRTPKVDGRVVAHDTGVWGAAAGMVVGTQTAHPLSLATAAATRLLVDSGGNVGIGTGKRTPEARLEIAGPGGENVDLLVNGRIRTSGTSAGVWLGRDSLFGLVNPDTVGLFTGGVRGAWRLVVDRHGRVGIGTEEPMAPLHIRSDGGRNVDLQLDGCIRSDSSDGGMWVGPHRFVGGMGQERMVLFSGGSGLTVGRGGGVAIGAEDAGKHKLLVNGGTSLDTLWVTNGIHFISKGRWRLVDNVPANTNPPNLCASIDVGAISDRRLKTAVRPIRDAGAVVARLDGVRYRWGTDGLEHLSRDAVASVSAGPDASAAEHARVRDEERRRALDELTGDCLGLVAQDVERVAPELVTTDADGYKRVRYTHLTALLLEGLKEQQHALADLTARLDSRP